jgi:transposase
MMMTNRFIKIGAAAELLGVSIDTLRKVDVVGVDLGVKSLATLSTGQNLQEKVVLVLDQKNFLRQFKLQIRLV